MKKGFTFIELLVAFAILTLLLGITTVFLRQARPRSTIQAAARDLATDLRYVSELAVSTQINHAVRFDSATAQYSLVALETPERTIKTVRLDQSLSFTTITLPGNTATFNALGAAVASGTITLAHTSGLTQIIDIRPSGYVRLE